MRNDFYIRASKLTESHLARKHPILHPPLNCSSTPTPPTMNNQQFRRLLLDKPSSSSKSSSPSDQNANTITATTATTLGSRARPSIPMTPRHLPNSSSSTTASASASALFRAQLRAQADVSPPPAKKPKTSAPKGSRLAAGYTDRAARLRATQEDTAEAADSNSKEARVRALEDMVRLGQMERADFERARDGIVGGDVGSVYLVKGLDWGLLRRARAGEDVFGDVLEEGEGKEGDVDAELEGLEGVEVRPVERGVRVKRGAMPELDAGAGAAGGRKRNRDDILREMREARARKEEEERAAREPALGARFRRIGAGVVPNSSWVERDGKGREVLIVVDAEGKVKRKVKKQRPGDGENGNAHALPMPDKDARPLGMDVDVPEDTRRQEPEPEEDEDIFADAGSDYNPLGNMEEENDSDSDRSEDGEVAKSPKTKASTKASTRSDHEKQAAPNALEQETGSGRPRNYFGTDMDPTTSSNYTNPMNDPSILNALKRASASKAADAISDQSGDQGAEKARLARVRARLAEQDRDAEDMDMGFGSSRFEDQDEGEERRVKLTEWKGLKQDEEDGDGEDDDKQGKSGKGQRKRGKKTKKADKNDVGTVLGILEKRKG